MAVEINQMSVRAQVRDQQNDNNCNTSRNNTPGARQQGGATDQSVRQAADAAAEFHKRLKER